MKKAIVYHSADPIRLTEHYFKIHHRQQGPAGYSSTIKELAASSLILDTLPLNLRFIHWQQQKRQIPKQRPYLSLSRNGRNQTQEPEQPGTPSRFGGRS